MTHRWSVDDWSMREQVNVSDEAPCCDSTENPLGRGLLCLYEVMVMMKHHIFRLQDGANASCIVISRSQAKVKALIALGDARVPYCPLYS